MNINFKCKECNKFIRNADGTHVTYSGFCSKICKKRNRKKELILNQERLKKIENSIKVKLLHQWDENNPEKYHRAKHRINVKRNRSLGWIPLNKSFEGSEGHHIDFDFVIYVPKELHQSVRHSLSKNINMEEINSKALDFLKNTITFK